MVPDAPGQRLIVLGFTIRAGRIAAIDLNADPAKMTWLDLDLA